MFVNVQDTRYKTRYIVGCRNAAYGLRVHSYITYTYTTVHGLLLPVAVSFPRYQRFEISIFWEIVLRKKQSVTKTNKTRICFWKYIPTYDIGGHVSSPFSSSLPCTYLVCSGRSDDDVSLAIKDEFLTNYFFRVLSIFAKYYDTTRSKSVGKTCKRRFSCSHVFFFTFVA